MLTGCIWTTTHSWPLRSPRNVPCLPTIDTTLNSSTRAKQHTRYLAEGRQHYGIILAMRRPSDSAVVARLLALLNSVTGEEMAKQLRYI